MRVLIFLWGVGWGSLKTFHVHFHTYAMLRCYAFWCISHPSCYATMGSLALLHIRHATPFSIFTHASCNATVRFPACVMQREWVPSCTFTHTSCYATVRSLALPRVRHAMLLCVLLHLRTYVMLPYCAFWCASMHMSSYCAVSCIYKMCPIDPIPKCSRLIQVGGSSTHTDTPRLADKIFQRSGSNCMLVWGEAPSQATLPINLENLAV